MKKSISKPKFKSGCHYKEKKTSFKKCFIAFALVLCLIPIPAFGALDSFTALDELKVTADVVGEEDAIPMPEVELIANIEQDIPLGSTITYRWQRSPVFDMPLELPPTSTPVTPPVSQSESASESTPVTPPVSPSESASESTPVTPPVSPSESASPSTPVTPPVSPSESAPPSTPASAPKSQSESTPETPPVSPSESKPESQSEPKSESTPESPLVSPLESEPDELGYMWEDIVDAFESTYTLTDADVDCYVRVLVTVLPKQGKARMFTNEMPAMAASQPLRVQPRADGVLTIYLKTGGTGNGASPQDAVGTLGAAVSKIPQGKSGTIQLVGSTFEDTELKKGDPGSAFDCSLDIINRSVTICGDVQGGTLVYTKNIFIMQKKQVLTLKNITMDGTLMSSDAKNDTFIMVNDATLNLESGSVIQNFNQNYSPIVLSTGYVYMKDGSKICNNVMAKPYAGNDIAHDFFEGRGGAVTITAGTFVMYGGEISENKVTDPSGKGSAIYLNANTVTNQWVPRLYVLGGTITNNSAAGGANGAIFVSNRRKVNNTTGRIPGLFVGGQASIINNTRPDGIGSVYLESGMTMTINNNVWVDDGLDLEGYPLTGGAKISVTAANPVADTVLATNSLSARDVDYFVMDTPGFGLKYNPIQKTLVMTTDNRVFLNPSAATDGDGSLGKPFNTWESAYAKAPSGATIMLMNPLALTDAVELKGNKTLILQGSDDAGSPSNQTITGGTNGIFNVSDENITLRNITLQGGHGETKPLLYLSASGAITLGSSATLQDGTAGGAEVAGGTMMMLKGSVVQNNSAARGGGILVGTGGYLDLQGGKITGNTATAEGGGIYAAGVVNLRGDINITGNKSGTNIPDNLYLRTGRTVNITSALTGTQDTIGVTVADAPMLGTVRVFAVNSNATDLAKFVFDKPGDLVKTRTGTNLLMTNYSKETRLDTLKRLGVLSAEVPIITEKTWAGTESLTGTETLEVEIPYAIQNKVLTFMAEARVDTDKINPGHTVQATVLQGGGKTATGLLTFTVQYDATKKAAGEVVTSFIIVGTPQDGGTKKQYNVTLKRGYPKLTNNNTVNVTFDKGDTNVTELSNFLVVDELRDNIVSVNSFKIRAENAAATDSLASNIAVSAINSTTGELTVMVQRTFLDGKMTDVSAGVKAGKITLSLWIDNYKMGNFVVNMLEVDNALINLYKSVANYDWSTAYPTDAHIRVQDTPAVGISWPKKGDTDLLTEVSGKWEGTPDEQKTKVKARLDTYALGAAEAVIEKLIEDSKITNKPKYRLDIESKYDTHAVNASADEPFGLPGKYTFRVDVVLLKDNDTDGSTLAGLPHTVNVIPKKYTGFTTAQLNTAIKNSALDGTLSGAVWVPMGATTKEIGSAIYREFVEKTDSIVRTTLEKLQQQYPNMIFEPVYPTIDEKPDGNGSLVRNDGTNYIANVTVRARPVGSDPADSVGAATATVEVRLDVNVGYEMNECQILLGRAQRDIMEALANGSQAIADIAPTSAVGQVAVEELLKSRLQDAITTPAGTVLTGRETRVLLLTLGKPLKELVTVELRPRSVNAFVPPVHGTASNPRGVNGQYTFMVTLHTTYNDATLSMPLLLSSSGTVVVVGTASGGSISDDGVVMLPTEYKDNSGGGSGDSGDSGNSGGGGGTNTPSRPPSTTTAPPATPAPPATSAPSVTSASPATTTPPARKPIPKPKPAEVTTSGDAQVTPETSESTSAQPDTARPSAAPIPAAAQKNITVTAVNASGLGVTLADNQRVIRAVLTDEEIKLAESGQKVEIALRVNPISSDAAQDGSEDEREIIRREMGKKQLALGDFLDIRLEKRVGVGDWLSVSTAGDNIQVELDVATEMKKDGRVYFIARLHDNQVSFLPNLSTDAGSIVFETNQFSTYAIVYWDAPDTVASSDNRMHKSGFLLLGMIIGCALTITVVLIRNKTRQKHSKLS